MITPLSAKDATVLRDFLLRAGFTDSEFQRRPTLRELPAKHAGNWPLLVDYTKEPTFLNTLLRLFLFGMTLDQRTVSSVLPPEVINILLQSGLLRPVGETWQPMCMLSPLDTFWFAADPVGRMQSDLAGDMVLWANPTTRILHQLSIRKPVESVLDLGAGCGVLSVLAAANGKKIVASDINERAQMFTEFNASLNGVTNIEWRTGDTFEPVGDQTFDLILANPPFFVTPSETKLYCENSMELDMYCRRVVREGAAHLKESGYLQMTLEWVQIEGQSWQERVSEWVEGTSCDAWIIRSYTGDLANYAFERMKDELISHPEQAEEKFNSWLDYYRKHKVEQICGGVLMLRRRSGKNWLRIEECPLELREPFGQSVEDVFATQTLLSRHPDDEELMQSKPRLASGVRLDQQFQLQDGHWTQASLQMKFERGLPGSINLEFAVADFLATCGGDRSLREIVKELSLRVNASEPEIGKQCCGVVRRLAERRFLAL